MVGAVKLCLSMNQRSAPRRAPPQTPTQGRYAVAAVGRSGARILRSFASRAEAEAYARTAQRNAGGARIEVRDTQAPPPAAAPRKPEFKPIPPMLLFGVVLFFAILLGGLGMIYLIEQASARS